MLLLTSSVSVPQLIQVRIFYSPERKNGVWTCAGKGSNLGSNRSLDLKKIPPTQAVVNFADNLEIIAVVNNPQSHPHTKQISTQGH